jgi:hypothetical protein
MRVDRILLVDIHFKELVALTAFEVLEPANR